MLRVVQENSTMSVSILQYGHGYNPGGILPGDISPTITTSSWEHNNFLLKPIMKQSTKTPPPIPCNDGGGVFWKGRHIKHGQGLYLSTTPGFFRGGLQDVSRTLKAESHDAGICIDYILRKFTPREAFRIMDVRDSDIDKILEIGLSDSKCYELAGNSIPVNCLYLIFRNMFIPEFMAEPLPPQPQKVVQPSLFDDWDL